jgi:hypothetical protein
VSVRLRWYAAVLSATTLKKLVRGMNEAKFSLRSGSGFFVRNARTRYVEGTHVRIERWERVVLLPSGEEVKIPETDIERVEFRFSCDFPQIELRDCPRSLRVLQEAVSNLVDDKLDFKPLGVDPLIWFSTLQETLGSGSVRAIAGAIFTVSPAVQGRVYVSGTEGVVDSFHQLAGSADVPVDRVLVEWDRSDLQVKCELGADARINITGAMSDHFRQSLRSALAQVAEKLPPNVRLVSG